MTNPRGVIYQLGLMSALGQFRKSALVTARSALPPGADIVSLATHVRFAPKAEVEGVTCRPYEVTPISRKVRSRSALCKLASTTTLQRRTSRILLLKRGLPTHKFQRTEPQPAPVCYRDGTKTSA